MKKPAAKKLYNLSDIISFRKDMHQNAETGFKEFQTQKKIQSYLLKIGIDQKQIKKCAKTGLYVDLKGKGPVKLPNRSIAIRADIDGLETHEGNKDLSYRSVNKAAHLCGHDGHTASLLGFASKYLEKIDQIPSNKTVRLLFQPCEESCKGTDGGAVEMIKEGCLKGIEEIYGFHNWPSAPLGKLFVKPGEMMAEIISIEIKIIGKGGHGSNPSICINPIQPAIDIHLLAREIIKEYESKNHKFRFSLPVFQAGTALNIIPDICNIDGTFRSLDETVSKDFINRFGNGIEEICKKYNCTVEKKISSLYPVLKNTEKETENIEKLAVEFFGKENVTNNELPVYASEDFAFFTKEIPGTFFFLSSQKNENDGFLHTQNYNFNDNLIPIASEFWIKIIENRLDLDKNIFNVKTLNELNEKNKEDIKKNVNKPLIIAKKNVLVSKKKVEKPKHEEKKKVNIIKKVISKNKDGKNSKSKKE